jgi:tetratricopeptide (TPR) repeat protein
MSYANSSEYEDAAIKLLFGGTPQQALELFEEGLRKFPQDPGLCLGCGMALNDLKRPADAREIFIRLIEQHPDLTDALQGLVEAELALGHEAAAAEAARKACNHPGESSVEFVYCLGLILYRHKLFADAERCYRRALELDRAHGYSWVGLAASLHQRGRRDEAIYLLKNAVEDRLPGFWEAYSYLGCMLFDAGREDDAKKVLGRIPLDELRDPAAASRLRSFLDSQSHPERTRVLAKIEARSRAALQAAEATPKRNADIVAIGDIHGELQRLTEVIRYANLLETWWENAWIGEDTVIVQTGDVIDRGPDSLKAYEAVAALQAKAREGGGQVIRLIGNHELMVLQGDYQQTDIEDPTSFRKRLIADLAAGKVQGAYAAQGFLFTHAGVRSQIMHKLLRRKQPAEVKDLPAVLAVEINRLLLGAVESGDYSHPIFQIGISRGGTEEVGGVFWADGSELFGSRRAGVVKQVFGHTPGKTIRISPSARRVDIDAGMVQGNPLSYLRIRNGKLLVRVVDSLSLRKREPMPRGTKRPRMAEPPK